MDLKQYIRTVPGFPKPGINFFDITTLLKEPEALTHAVERMAEPFLKSGIHRVVGMEARGFILGAPIAIHLGAGFVPVRKPGKLPAPTHQVSYQLEYGEDTLCIHQDAIQAGEKVLIVDDLLATGGTVGATIELVRKLGGEVVGVAFLIDLVELKDLPPRRKLDGVTTHVVLPM
ncbi:MAG: adenine phosphoribosyltransferase [Nitrospirota bacterium]|nr:adenine phosphoribosyltransferase [Nitrospirota bacterium]